MRFIFPPCVLGLAGMLAPLLLFASVRSPIPVGDISFPTQAQLGNVFTLGEEIRIEATVLTGTQVNWTVTDFTGTQVDSGSSPVNGHHVVITPSDKGKGFYSVFLTAKAGEIITGQSRTSYAVIAPVPLAEVNDSKFGVMTHFAQNMPLDVLPLLAKAGIGWTRDEQYWAAIETHKGDYEFPAKYEDYMAELKKYHLNPLIVASFGNTLYDHQPGVPVYQLAPHSPEGFDAYANYAADVLQHDHGQIKAMEIWNEYNGSFCAGQAAADRPRFYTGMLQAAYTRIKSVQPDVTVIGGAAVKIPLPYFEKLFQLGALKSLDALAIHPYEATPEGVERQVASLVELTKKYNGGKSKPIWVTESSLFGDETPERARPASYLVRLFTLLRTQPEVEHLFWYLAQDYGQDFHNLGLLHGNFDPMGKCTPVMTYPAYANLIQLLDHAVFRQRENTDSRTRIYQFEKARQTIWVCWSTSGTGQINFTANGPVRLINLVGGEQQMFPVHGQVTIMAGDPPVYVMADAGVVTTVTEVPRAEQVLADSARDFSSEQGKDNWTYLYFASNKDGSAAYDPTQAQPMKWEPSPGDWQDYWAGPAGYFFIGEANCSPSVVNRGQGWAVRRWTSPISGLIHIVGQVRRLAQGDGVGVQVYLDGNKIFSRMLTPDSSTTIDLNLVVEKAARLDFVVTPGPGLDANYDATSEEIMILTPSR